MHELSIAAALVRQALDVARENNLARIEALEVELGALQQVVPEALDLAFQAESRDTPAAGAVLHLVEVPMRARCRSCGKAYAPDIDCFRCEACGRADPEIVEGRDIILKSLSGPEREREDLLEDQGH